MAKKVTKKKNRKLRRQIRKTVGALLMISAITVAAIPVQDVSANPTVSNEKIKVAVTSQKGQIRAGDATYGFESAVPYVADATGDKNNQVIYTSGDGIFKFAYIRGTGAVILDYEDLYNNESLTIPETLEAYRNYSENYQGQEYYCMVSANDELMGYKLQNQPLVDGDGKPLYRTTDRMPNGTDIENLENITDVLSDADGYYILYSQTKPKRDGNGAELKDEHGQIIYETVQARANVEPMYGERYYPCYYSQRDVWSQFSDQELYYHPKKADNTDDYTKWEQVGDDNTHWGIRAVVKYIGAEKIKTKGTGWELDGERVTPDEGVFANKINIVNLNIEASLNGVSDYAFYNCPRLQNVSFKTGLQTVGNGVFAGCQQLKSVDMPTATAIGKDAFYNCTSLTSFKVPADTLSHLGDCAFEGCTQLQNVDFLLYNDDGTQDTMGSAFLKYLGNHLFRGCTSLSSMEFPNGYSETDPLDIDMFQDCTALQYIKLPDTDSGARIVFDCNHSQNGSDYPNCTGNTWEKFREMVPESFYFEGPSISDIHTKANDNSITFKYPNEQLYERVVYEHDAIKDAGDADGKSAKVFYQVRVDGNNVGTLEKFGILNYDNEDVKSHPDIITIPEKFGTFGISNIGQGSFNDNCDLVKVTIPASVSTIGANAFKGCHKLRTIIFTDATTITSIGADAFKTQETYCGDNVYPDAGEPEPYLYFVGAMLKEDGSDTETFKYAMNGTSKISHSNSPDIWITCHSGWPTNLEVQYYKEPTAATGEAQLVGYPRYDELSADALTWAENLPYVTNDTEAAEYAEMINRAIQYNQGVTLTPELTPNEQAFLAATLNVTIPESVDRIEPGLFSGYDSEGKQVGLRTPDTSIKSVTINGVDELEPYTFKGCTALQSAAVIGSSLIDDYAFEDCTGLTDATLGSNLSDTGKRPFKGCTELRNINCLAPSNFVYNSGILYRQTDSGLEIVECLENRGQTGGTGLYTVGPDELNGVTSIKEEAFAECDKIAQVDLSSTTVRTIPVGCFQDMELNSIVLPSTLSSIEADAFKGGQARRFVVYFKNSNPITMTEDAFEPKDGDKDQVGDREVIFQCAIPSNAATYADYYAYITASDAEVYEEFTVRFYNRPDYPASTNLELLSRQTVRAGEDAVAPDTEDLSCNDETLVFIGWDKPYTNVQADLDVLAMYGAPQYEVTFIDGYTGDTLKVEMVSLGGSATPPEVPEHPGQVFMGWDKPYYNIQEDTRVIARYADGSGDINRHTVSFYLSESDEEPWWTTYASEGEVIMAPIAPARPGYTFSRWLWVPASSANGIKQDTSVYAQWTSGSSSNPSGSPGNSGDNGNNGSNNNGSNSSASPSASPTASPDVKKYTVSVSGGSGSGSYAAGEIVSINAYYMGDGQLFDKWTTSTAGVGFANPNATSTTFTMPAANVAITATYKTGSAGSTTTTTGGSGTGSSGTSTSTGSTNNGTIVEVTKPGISNTNLAGATVSGATDNFIVKITEDQTATDAVVAALQARYGDISRIKYLPMDISLYDSTGRIKIADTTGITVNLTLPLPDDLIQYAGNNKVAAVSGGALEDLNVRFTTVDGVPCVNFTATHFSPYVIYVDTANLTEATIDATPKTGDPIHPKWFLSLGLACVSLILFFKRDKVIINTKTA